MSSSICLLCRESCDNVTRYLHLSGWAASIYVEETSLESQPTSVTQFLWTPCKVLLVGVYIWTPGVTLRCVIKGFVSFQPIVLKVVLTSQNWSPKIVHNCLHLLIRKIFNTFVSA